MSNSTAARPGVKTAFEYLRKEALDAHLAGDGMRVIHICTVGLEQLGTQEPCSLELSDVRWCFFLGLYWGFENWFLGLAESSLKKVGVGAASSGDKILVEYLINKLRVPLQPLHFNPIENFPIGFFDSRAAFTEDIAAITLCFELVWHENPSLPLWSELHRISPRQDGAELSPLHRELQRLFKRLRQFGHFWLAGASLPTRDSLPSGTASEQQLLVEGWRLFFEARFDELSIVVRQLTERLRSCDSPYYPAFFQLAHRSRFQRGSKESQSLSLSRRNLVISRQPSEVVRQLRDSRFEAAFNEIAMRGFASNCANERITCFRIAILNELQALRSWDIGSWLDAERQFAEISLELCYHRQFQLARQAILSLVRSLTVPDRGKYPHFDLAIQQLDALSAEDRREFVIELMRSPRICWQHVNTVLIELSDAIPPDILPDVARWSVELEMDKFHSTMTRTRLDLWNNILSVAPNAVSLIEVLEPALLVRSEDPACWDTLSSTFIAAMKLGSLGCARAIVNRIILTKCDDEHWNQYKFAILADAAESRIELREQCLSWLNQHAKERNNEFQLFALRGMANGILKDRNDINFRNSLRNSVIADCNRILGEAGTFSVGVTPFHNMASQLTWRRAEPELVEKLIEVIESPNVPYVNKFVPVCMLAVLLKKGPQAQAVLISQKCVDWLASRIEGKSLGQGGPLSIVQIGGMQADSLDQPIAWLLDVTAEKCCDVFGDRLATWMMSEGIRRPAIVIDYTIRTAINLSIGLLQTNEEVSMALVGIAEAAAHAAFPSQPVGVVNGYRSVLFPFNSKAKPTKWLRSAAGALCLSLFARRIMDASLLANADARFASAVAIRTWRVSSTRLPPELQQVIERLSLDCRMRVRHALQDTESAVDS